MSEHTLINVYVPMITRVRLTEAESAMVESNMSEGQTLMQVFSSKLKSSGPSFANEEAKKTEADQHGRNAMLNAEQEFPGGTPGADDGLLQKEGDTLVAYIHMGMHARRVVHEMRAEIELLSDIVFAVGAVKWLYISFTCKTLNAESAFKKLQKLGLGLKGGVGSMHSIAIKVNKVSTSAATLAPEKWNQLSTTPSGSDIGKQFLNASAIAAPYDAGGQLSSHQSTNTAAASSEQQINANNNTTSLLAVFEPPTPVPVPVPETGTAAVNEGAPMLPDGAPQDHVVSFALTPEQEEKDIGRNAPIEAVRSNSSQFDPSIHDPQLEYMSEDEGSADDEEVVGMKGYANHFKETISARIAVDQVIEMVQAGSEFTFDYVMFLLIAAMLACIGLVTNNSVVIVASMLVSPLMGPILGVTFGFTLRDAELVKKGLFSELLGLAICILTGFIGGLIASISMQEGRLPTDEMWGRMSGVGVIIGIAIAIPSGVGVALSVLGNNTSSLVGVAISASLLPPAVNSGILLAQLCFIDDSFRKEVPNPQNPDQLINITQHNIATGSGYSFLLTVANILCIWVSAALMFKLKEVAPNSSEQEFWREWVPKARTYFKEEDSSNLKTVRTELGRHLERQRAERTMRRRFTQQELEFKGDLKTLFETPNSKTLKSRDSAHNLSLSKSSRTFAEEERSPVSGQQKARTIRSPDSGTRRLSS